jgi:hypothetical protein
LPARDFRVISLQPNMPGQKQSEIIMIILNIVLLKINKWNDQSFQALNFIEFYKYLKVVKHVEKEFDHPCATIFEFGS